VTLHLQKTTMFPGSLHISLPSGARLSGSWPDPRLCVPISRWVCLYRQGVSGDHWL